MSWHDKKVKVRRENSIFHIIRSGFSEMIIDFLENLHDFVSESWMIILIFIGLFSGVVGALIIHPLYRLGGIKMILRFFAGAVPPIIWFVTPILGVTMIILIILSYQKGIEGLAKQLDD